MMIKPLFGDGFLDDSDYEAETNKLIRAKFEDDDDSEDEEDDDNELEAGKSKASNNNSSSIHGSEDGDTVEREANSDLQEPKQRKRANTPSGQAGREATTAPPPSSSSSTGKKKRKSTSSAAQQEKMVTLGQLLTNVVILEEMVKEVIAIAQVRKAMGVDTVRFL